MAKKATGKAKTGGKSSTSKMVVARGGDRRQTSGRRSSDTAGDAFIKLLQSPLVAELVAVAATAALGALAQEGISGAGSGTKRAGNAVKRAGKAAAKAVGDRLKTEIDEVKKASKARAGAKA